MRVNEACGTPLPQWVDLPPNVTDRIEAEGGGPAPKAWVNFFFYPLGLIYLFFAHFFLPFYFLPFLALVRSAGFLLPLRCLGRHSDGLRLVCGFLLAFCLLLSLALDLLSACGT